VPAHSPIAVPPPAKHSTGILMAAHRQPELPVHIPFHGVRWGIKWSAWLPPRTIAAVHRLLKSLMFGNNRLQISTFRPQPAVQNLLRSFIPELHLKKLPITGTWTAARSSQAQARVPSRYPGQRQERKMFPSVLRKTVVFPVRQISRSMLSSHTRVNRYA